MLRPKIIGSSGCWRPPRIATAWYATSRCDMHPHWPLQLDRGQLARRPRSLPTTVDHGHREPTSTGTRSTTNAPTASLSAVAWSLLSRPLDQSAAYAPVYSSDVMIADRATDRAGSHRGLRPWRRSMKSGPRSPAIDFADETVAGLYFERSTSCSGLEPTSWKSQRLLGDILGSADCADDNSARSKRRRRRCRAHRTPAETGAARYTIRRIRRLTSTESVPRLRRACNLQSLRTSDPSPSLGLAFGQLVIEGVIGRPLIAAASSRLFSPPSLRDGRAICRLASGVPSGATLLAAAYPVAEHVLREQPAIR